MATRYYNRTLSCGCSLSSDGGGGLMPCHYGYGCGKKGCDENNECDDCIKQVELCSKSWKKWKESSDYKKHLKETWENNNDTPYEEPDKLTELVKKKLRRIKNGDV